MSRIILGLGSLETTKVGALWEAIFRLGRDLFDVRCSAADSHVDGQPMGDITGLGAENRARAVLEVHLDADYGIGAESGLQLGRRRWLDVTTVIVVSRLTGCVVAESTSVGLPMPQEYVLEAMARDVMTTTAGSVFAERVPGVNARNWHGAVTGGRLDRTGLMADAFYAALVQVPGV